MTFRWHHHIPLARFCQCVQTVATKLTWACVSASGKGLTRSFRRIAGRWGKGLPCGSELELFKVRRHGLVLICFALLAPLSYSRLAFASSPISLVQAVALSFADLAPSLGRVIRRGERTGGPGCDRRRYYQTGSFFFGADRAISAVSHGSI